VNQIESIQVNCVAQVQLRAIGLRCQWKKVYHCLDCTYSEDTSSADAEKWCMTVASIIQGLHRRLIPLLDNYHTSSVANLHCWKCLHHGKKLIKISFSILDDEKTLQLYGNASTIRLEVAIQTYQHLEKHCIISWWHMLFPPCGPSAMNQMNCLLVALKRCHRNCYCIVRNAFSIIATSDILVVINVVSDVGKYLETPSTVIL